MLTVIVERKLNTTFINLPTSILILKRFTGNKPIGHAHKLLTKLHSKPEFATSNMHTTNSDIKPNTNPQITPVDQPYDTMSNTTPTHKHLPTLANGPKDFPSLKDKISADKDPGYYKFGNPRPEITAAEKFRFLEDKKIIEYSNSGSYGKNGLARVSLEAQQEFNTTDNKPTPRISTTVENDNPRFVGGVLMIRDSTDTPSSLQIHPIFGVLNPTSGEIEIFAMATSETGTTPFPNNVTTTKLYDTNIAGQKKAQFARYIIPPKTVHPGEFDEVEEATEFANKAEVMDALEAIKAVTDKFEPTKWSPKGFTLDELFDHFYVDDDNDEKK